jgi:hypothetical protein
VSVEARGAEAPADWGTLRSPENYTGYARTENFHPPVVWYLATVIPIWPRRS